MQYINPIEILGLSFVSEANNMDNEVIKKAKRKLFADIDLSEDDHFNYYGIQLSKSDCERVIDELSDNQKKEFYFYLITNKKLNEFLVNSNNELFNYFQNDSIFKIPEFVNFISPYFAINFDKVLLSAFENQDVEFLQSILKTSFLISQSHINIAFKSITNTLQDRIVEINKIRMDIKNEESFYDDDDINEIVDLVRGYFPSDILNSLPNYFQSQILKIANEINYMSVAVWDNFDNTQVCQDLLEHILTLNIDGLDKPTFEDNYEIIKKKNQERNEEEKNAPILRKYADFLIESKAKLNEIENKTLTPHELMKWVNNSISMIEINQLSETFEEIKNQVALSLRAMSVSVWNSYSNIGISIDLIDKAKSIIGVKTETKENLSNAKKQLNELKRQIVINNSSRKNTNTTSENNSGCLWLIGIAIVIGIIIANSDSNKSNSYSPNDVNTTDIYSNDNFIDSTAIAINEDSSSIESGFKENQLEDGASPFNDCFGKGIYNGNAKLTIENGGSADAIVCLYSVEKGRTIRNEYVRKNSSFTMSNIAQGNYKIRVFYGNDWNPNLTNSCGTNGNFESDVSFSEFDGTHYFEDSDMGFTNATITLYTVEGGNAPSSSIDQSTFFNK